MKDCFRSRYDPTLAAAMYVAYEEGDDSILNELLCQLCPLIRRTFVSRIGAGKPQQDVLEGEALESLFMILRAKSLPHHPRVFTKYLSVSILRSMYESLGREKPQQFKYWKVARTPEVSMPGRGHQATEVLIYYDQLVKFVRKTVIERFRFIQKEREACVFILDCELGKRIINSNFVRRRYHLTQIKTKYLIRYVRILVKASAWDYLEHEGPDSFIASLWEAGGGILRPPN